MHPVLKEVLNDTKALTLDAFRILRDRWLVVLALAAVAATAAALIHGYDDEWHHRMTDYRTRPVRLVARAFTRWGDYATGTLIVSASLWLAGTLLRPRRGAPPPAGWLSVAHRRRWWQLAGLACFLAATLAGATNNALRYAAGRPRPFAELPDRFHGPRAGHEFRSFPSGHAATSFATATTLTVVVPTFGLPALGFAGGVVWSRLYLRDHYASDVTVGAAIGVLFGLAFGLAARRRAVAPV